MKEKPKYVPSSGEVKKADEEKYENWNWEKGEITLTPCQEEAFYWDGENKIEVIKIYEAINNEDQALIDKIEILKLKTNGKFEGRWRNSDDFGCTKQYENLEGAVGELEEQLNKVWYTERKMKLIAPIINNDKKK